jgi:2-oxoglutarate dehydrogenase E2 component (dihydrolipoamide succinyltransferase)
VQIDVSVNATEAGTITELLVNEEDTVTVGQDLAKIESGGEKPAESPKEDAKPEPAAKEPSPAPKEAESQPPPPPKEAESQPSPPKQEPKPSPPKEEKKPSSTPPPPPPKKSEPKKNDEDADKKFKLWTRDERRVS